jgi:ubiquinol-cytochrome c reductase cytochrome b subunit
MRFKNIILNTIYESGVSYPAPANLTYWWNFGVLALFCLIIQIITGIFLAMHYIPNANLAFNSVENIMRDVDYGWLIRYMHANGASMFFFTIYIHIFRGLYYASYTRPRQLLWITGVIILLIMILTAFMGYVLPWGQMSFWAATVITNLVSAVPYIGQDILNWLWGGYSVDNATLNRFFSFHYLLPFILTGLVGVHLIYLHENGSNNFLGISFKGDKIPFAPYFVIKDIYGVIIFLILFSFFIYFDPVYLGHPDNFIPANPLVTPTHIVPEWYFLPFYAILRSVPNKLFGVILLLASIIVLLIFPFIVKSKINTGFFRPLYQIFFWIFFFNCILLGWIGGKAIEEPFYLLGQLFTIYYFSYFLIILPILSFCEYIWYFKQESKFDFKLYNPYRMKKSYNKFFKLKNGSFIISDFLNNWNNNFFYIVIFFLILFMMGVCLYCDGDRIPGYSILICGFIVYFFITRSLKLTLNNIVNNILKYWYDLNINNIKYLNHIKKNFLIWFKYFILLIFLNPIKNFFFFKLNKILLIYLIDNILKIFIYFELYLKNIFIEYRIFLSFIKFLKLKFKQNIYI